MDVADDETLWPDRDNPMLVINYSKGGFVRVGGSLGTSIEQRARKLVQLVGLDRHKARGWPDPAERDKRWQQREEVWATAEHCLKNFKALQASDEAKQLVLNVAKGYGFFSIWFHLFGDHPEVRLSLIEEFAGTAIECFDNAGSPIKRPNGVI